MAFACAVVFGAEKTHWAFKPVANPKPPKVHDKAWPLGDLDRFILNPLEQKGLRPVAESDRFTWRRRGSFDLTGLPPTAMYIGTQEQLYPGALAFRDKLLAQDPDADFTVIIGDGQLHGWALGGLVINSQAPIWRSTVYRQLGLFSEVNSARIATVRRKDAQETCPYRRSWLFSPAGRD